MIPPRHMSLYSLICSGVTDSDPALLAQILSFDLWRVLLVGLFCSSYWHQTGVLVAIESNIMKLVHLSLAFITRLILTLSLLINCYTFNIIEFRATKNYGWSTGRHYDIKEVDATSEKERWISRSGGVVVGGCWSESWILCFLHFQELHAMVFTVTAFVEICRGSW